jgi:hypothetical protein
VRVIAQEGPSRAVDHFPDYPFYLPRPILGDTTDAPQWS